MTKILMTTARIDRGVAALDRLLDTIEGEVDGKLSAREVARFRGRGKALLEKLHRYARHLDAERSRAPSSVDRVAVRTGAAKLARALKRIALDRGDKDGRLSGTADELGRASRTAQSLARWIHANVA